MAEGVKQIPAIQDTVFSFEGELYTVGEAQKRLREKGVDVSKGNIQKVAKRMECDGVIPGHYVHRRIFDPLVDGPVRCEEAGCRYTESGTSGCGRYLDALVIERRRERESY